MQNIYIKFSSGKVISQRQVNLRPLDFDWVLGYNKKTFLKNLKNHYDKDNSRGKIVSVNIKDSGMSLTIND